MKLKVELGCRIWADPLARLVEFEQSLSQPRRLSEMKTRGPGTPGSRHGGVDQKDRPADRA